MTSYNLKVYTVQKKQVSSLIGQARIQILPPYFGSSYLTPLSPTASFGKGR